MAPEVLDCRPYNTSVDVYSAGVILLELLEPGSEKPFSELTLDNFHRQVVGAGYRPGRAGAGREPRLCGVSVSIVVADELSCEN